MAWLWRRKAANPDDLALGVTLLLLAGTNRSLREIARLLGMSLSSLHERIATRLELEVLYEYGRKHSEERIRLYQALLEPAADRFLRRPKGEPDNPEGHDAP